MVAARGSKAGGRGLGQKTLHYLQGKNKHQITVTITLPATNMELYSSQGVPSQTSFSSVILITVLHGRVRTARVVPGGSQMVCMYVCI